MRRALALWRETGDPAGAGRALFGMSLVFQVLRRDWAAALPYLRQAADLAEARRKAATCTGARRSTGTWVSTS